jgi:hypothetical protein
VLNFNEYDLNVMRIRTMETGNIIHQEPDQIGGHIVVSNCPEGFDGKVIVRDGSHKTISITPSLAVATSIAIFASSPNGGYGSIYISEAKTEDVVTHSTFYDWLV